MTLLPQLKDQLVASRPTRARRRTARTIVAFVAIALLVAAGALAAGGVIPIGTSVEPPARFHGDPEVGQGVPVRSTPRLLPLRVPDPDGGPAWGLRTVRTSRGLICVQVGRVVDGKLGVLGQDGIAGNDGRFHELSPRFATLGPGCAAPDANGSAFLAIDSRGMASGEGPRRSCLGPGESSPRRPRCPKADHRRFLYGLLGPEAVGLDYRHKGRVRSAEVARPEGAYLVVLAEPQRFAGSLSGVTPSMGHPFTRITYRDGSTCPRAGTPATPRDPCPPRGRQPLLAGLDRDAVRRPLRAAVLPPPRRGRPLRRLQVTFRAPVAVDDARSTYQLTARFQQTCRGLYLVPSTNRDVERGALVRLIVGIPRRCHGPVRGTVVLTATTGGMPGGMPDPRDKTSNITIGRFNQRVPKP
jgi:hypothetical protein